MPKDSKTIKLYKRYSDGKVKALEVNDTAEARKVMMQNGFYASKKEAEAGKVKE